MSDDNGSEANVRRSRRIAAKADDKPQLVDLVLDELEREESSSSSGPITAKKSAAGQVKKKIYRGNFGRPKLETTGTLFDKGLKAVNIVGATSVTDEAKGVDEICYLIKYDNGQFELVVNTVAHKFCPLLVIDFLESRINFREKADIDFTQELFGESSQLSHLADIPESQLAQQMDSSNRSIEI